jgi:hypothetical protein
VAADRRLRLSTSDRSGAIAPERLETDLIRSVDSAETYRQNADQRHVT